MTALRSAAMLVAIAMIAIANLAAVGSEHVPWIPRMGPRPTIVIIEDGDSPYRDVVINVKETQTGSLMFGAGVNSDAGLVGSVVLNEQRMTNRTGRWNLWPLRWIPFDTRTSR
jgi:hypothetical protein